MAGHGCIKADMMWEKELRAEKEAHVDPTGNRKWSEAMHEA